MKAVLVSREDIFDSSRSIKVEGKIYTLTSLDIDQNRRRIYITGNDEEYDFNTFFFRWFALGIDRGQGIDPNYKKDVEIINYNQQYNFEGCFLSRVTDRFRATIIYDRFQM